MTILEEYIDKIRNQIYPTYSVSSFYYESSVLRHCFPNCKNVDQFSVSIFAGILAVIGDEKKRSCFDLAKTIVAPNASEAAPSRLIDGDSTGEIAALCTIGEEILAGRMPLDLEKSFSEAPELFNALNVISEKIKPSQRKFFSEDQVIRSFFEKALKLFPDIQHESIARQQFKAAIHQIERETFAGRNEKRSLFTLENCLLIAKSTLKLALQVNNLCITQTDIEEFARNTQPFRKVNSGFNSAAHAMMGVIPGLLLGMMLSCLVGGFCALSLGGGCFLSYFNNRYCQWDPFRCSDRRSNSIKRL